MRILIINSEYPPVGGGAGNASANIAQELRALGQEVTVLTTRFGDLPREELRQGVHIRRAPGLRKHLDRSTPLEQFSFILGGAFEALRVVRVWRPDVVLAFFGMPGGVIALFLKLLFGLPYVVSLRGGDVPGFRPYDFALYHRLLGPLLRVVWRSSAQIVANSTGLRELANEFSPNTHIEVIPNGVNLKHFSFCERSWDPPHLLFVGRLVYQKGLDVLFESLSALQSLPWELSLVGDGPQFKPLQELAASKGIAERVYFHNWLQGEALLEQYRQANLFVFPSRHEGMPNAVLEAMASGLPVLATDIAGNEELVIPDHTGLLVSPDNPAALQKALELLLTDPDCRERMGSAARQRVEDHYSWSWVAEQYLKRLERVVRNPKTVQSIA